MGCCLSVTAHFIVVLNMQELLSSATLLFILLNPFLVIVYLTDIVQRLDEKAFRNVLFRAGIISTGVFCCFTILGDAIFSRFMQVEFASFQIFGGIVFMLIGLQFVFRGPGAIELLRGESRHLAGAVAMPVLIGPGTISASVVIGKRHDSWVACTVIFLSVAICLVTIVVLKRIHDRVKPRNEPLVERYFEIAGRITALVVGTISVEMIMKGMQAWLEKL